MTDIAIIGGCGHVGLPLGLAFAEVGKQVAAVDIDGPKVEATNAGEMPFSDRGADDLLTKVLKDGTFIATTDPAIVRESEVIVTVIGTPVDEHLNPRFDVMQRFVNEIREYLVPNQLLVLRSTLFPGSTARVKQLLDKMGLDVDVAFCPERVAEGVALEEIKGLPQIVAGVDERSQKRAEELFALLTPDIIRLETTGAELAKLFTNAWRYIQFSVANQFYMIANDYGIDFYDVHNAMTFKYPRAKDFPRAGFAAGPCLFKDTMQLSAFHNNNFFLGHSAMLINEGLPNYIVQRARRRFPDLSEKKVAILGMAFKPNSDDPRDSLSFKLRSILQAEAAEVLCVEPNFHDERFVSLDEAMDEADLVILGVPHSQFRELDFGKKPLIDIWNMTNQRMDVI